VFTSLAGTTVAFNSAAFTVAIVGNFMSGDMLTFDGASNPKFTSQWDSVHGLLKVSVQQAPTNGEFVQAIGGVYFSASNAAGMPRTITWAVQQVSSSILGPIYVPSGASATSEQARVAEYVSAPGASYAEAKTQCENRQWNGIAGKLAAIGNASVATVYNANLGGSSAWLAGKGVPVAGSSVWQWDQGSQLAGTVFYRGDDAIGRSSTFSAFGGGFPASIVDGTFSYTVLMNGQWSSLAPDDTTVSGFICEYFGAGVTSSMVSGTTTLLAAGCFEQLCSYTVTAACAADPRCQLSGSTCGATPCGSATVATDCNSRAGCYMDASLGVCKQTPVGRTTTGCGRYPAGDTASCNMDTTCRVGSEGDCVPRLCGYSAQLNCLSDDRCSWNTAASTCGAAECIAVQDQTTCTANANCVFNAQMVPPCIRDECAFSQSDECVAVSVCVWTPTVGTTTGTCSRNICPSLTNAECSANAQCAWQTSTNVCGKAACSAGTQEACSADPTGCQWTNTSVAGTSTFFAQCQPLSLNAMAARAAADDDASVTCSTQTKNMLALAIFLIIFALLLLIGLIWMCKRQANAKSKQMDFSQKLMEQDELDDLMDQGHDIQGGSRGLATNKKSSV
jgi:hypothetical protein